MFSSRRRCMLGDTKAAPTRGSMRLDRGLYVYHVYGITLYSEIAIPLPSDEHVGLATIELRTAPPSFFSDRTRNVSLQQTDGSFYELGRLPDGSFYARWRGVGEFLVSADGSQIFCRQLSEATTESFHVYLLGQALSFAIVQRGLEPLHGTVIAVRGKAVPL